jgi:hypothetical protein
MQRPGRSALLTPDGRSRILADGTVMRLLGFGVWQLPAWVSTSTYDTAAAVSDICSPFAFTNA